MSSPIEPYRASVEPQWIDYNGHMNVAFYVLLFDRASDHFLDHLELGGDYRRRTDHSIYVLEMHVQYLREVKVGDPLLIETHIVGADAKRMHIVHKMTHAVEGYVAATNEIMALHVDLAGPRSAPFPPETAARLEKLVAEDNTKPLPIEIGRRIALPGQRAPH